MNMLHRIPAIFGLGVLLAIPPGVHASDGVQISDNWAGYGSRHAAYTGISALLQVPYVASTGHTSAWVGIGGTDSNSSLIQAGIAVDDNVMSFFFETVTGDKYSGRVPAMYKNGSIGSQDYLRFTIQEIKPQRWQMSTTAGNTVSQITIPFYSMHDSAEWIVEAPSLAGAQLPLAHAHWIFKDMSVLVNGVWTTPGWTYPDTILMAPLGQPSLGPAPLQTVNGKGDAFVLNS